MKMLWTDDKGYYHEYHGKWKCPVCNEGLWYSEKWDARYCKKCNAWRENKCGCLEGSDCPFKCWLRPHQPFESVELKSICYEMAQGNHSDKTFDIYCKLKGLDLNEQQKKEMKEDIFGK